MPILVSMLEMIMTTSTQGLWMSVIVKDVRPQFFIQLIGLLRNAALNSLKYKLEELLIREQNIDITTLKPGAPSRRLC